MVSNPFETIRNRIILINCCQPKSASQIHFYDALFYFFEHNERGCAKAPQSVITGFGKKSAGAIFASARRKQICSVQLRCFFVFFLYSSGEHPMAFLNFSEK